MSSIFLFALLLSSLGLCVAQPVQQGAVGLGAGAGQPFQYNGPTYPSLAASLAAAGANPNAFAAGPLQQPIQQGQAIGGFGQQIPAGTNLGFGALGVQQQQPNAAAAAFGQYGGLQQPLLGAAMPQYNPYQAPTFNPYGVSGLATNALPQAGFGGLNYNPYANVVAQALQGVAGQIGAGQYAVPNMGMGMGMGGFGQPIGMMGAGVGAAPIQFGGQPLMGFQQPQQQQRPGPMSFGNAGPANNAGPMGAGGPPTPGGL